MIKTEFQDALEKYDITAETWQASDSLQLIIQDSKGDETVLHLNYWGLTHLKAAVDAALTFAIMEQVNTNTQTLEGKADKQYRY